jgi:S-DNA-T family DNA segregation ATPase FtsK/SpoIIIE
VGIYDDPERMTQAPLLVDVTESNLFLLGSSQTGKTVFVQTMVASLARLYTPRDVNIYIIDGGNSIPKTFEQSGIIGGICYREEEERMGNLLNMLSNEFENRGRKFAQASVGNYRSYLASGYNDLPHILVILDNAVAFKEFCTEIYEELIAMSREGLGLGVYFIVTSTQYSVLSPKIMIGFGTRLALNCNDTSEYSNLFDRCRMEPKNTPGRGLVQMEKRILEFQTAWSANGKNEQERNENIVAAFLKRNQSYGGMAARPIPMVPDILPANEFYASFKPKTPYAIPIGISYNTVEPVLLPLLEYSMLPVIGRSRSGRTNFIRQVLGAIQRTTLLNRTRCYIIDSMQQPLESCSKNYGFVAGYTVNAQDAPGILQEVVQELEKRQQYLVENRQKGREEDLLKDLPLLLVVAENPDFIAEMSRDKETVQLINAFLKLNRYKALILINNVENVSFTGMSSPELGKRLRDAKQAILMEDLANWRIFDASPKLLRQYPKPLRQGDAYLYSQGVVTDKIRTIFMNE